MAREQAGTAPPPDFSQPRRPSGEGKPLTDLPQMRVHDKGDIVLKPVPVPAVAYPEAELPYELACAVERAEASATAALLEKATALGIDLTKMRVEYRFEPIPLRPGDSPDSAYFNVVAHVSLIPPAVDEETSWKPRP